MLYCESCRSIVEEEKCPVCGSRKIREPEENDACLLAGVSYVESSILSGLLNEKEIPFWTQAAGSIHHGPMMYPHAVFVLYRHWAEARAVLEELPQAAERESEPESPVQNAENTLAELSEPLEKDDLDIYKLEGMNQDELIAYRKELRSILKKTVQREELIRDMIDEISFWLEVEE